jgi:serine/threonine-protein kinase
MMPAEGTGVDFEREPELVAGSLFGAYVIERCIGHGGMGAVYEARHRELGKRVALKALHRRIAADPRARARFLAEGRATSRLRHPHVVDVSDHGILEGVPFLVMEFLEGETLERLIAREGPLSVERAVEIMLPVCAAVSATHQEGIVHRDLKPANIFVSRDRLGREQTKVLDFGVSKIESADVDGLTSTGALLGTPWYMSPEQAQDPRNAHAASDQYTLAVILAECVTGRRAFEGRSLYPVLRNIVLGAMLKPRSLRPELPERFEAIILRAASVDISARFPSVDDLARALLPFAPRSSRDSWQPVFGVEPEPEPAPAPSPTTPPIVIAPSVESEPPPSTSSSPPARALGRWVGVALLAALGLAFGWWAQRSPASPAPSTVGRAIAPPPVVLPIAPRPAPSPAPPPPPVVIAPAVVAAPPAVTPPPSRAPSPRARAAVRPTRRQLGANGAPIEE